MLFSSGLLSLTAILALQFNAYEILLLYSLDYQDSRFMSDHSLLSWFLKFRRVEERVFSSISSDQLSGERSQV